MARKGRESSDDLRGVYRRHVDAVYAFFAYSVSRAWAEDLTSATFERVVRSWKDYDPARSGERTWILTIARNLLTDHYRRQKHRDAVSTDEHPGLLEGLTTANDPLDRAIAADELRAWLSRLGDREREVLALRYAADLSAAEIARMLDLTSANVHQIVSRSLRRLREAADQEGISRSA